MPINNELRKAAAEIAAAGHAGWGNVCTDALNEIERLTAALAAQAGQSEPVAIYQYQMADGSWIDQIRDSYEYNVRFGQATVRIVYAHPAPVRQPLSDFDAADSFMTEPHTDDVFEAYQQGIRFAERHHEITAQKGRT